MVMYARGAKRAAIARAGGMVLLELVVAMGILVSVMLPVAFSFAQEQRLARAEFFRAIAMEVVDGEAEVLQAGGWRAFGPGQHRYEPRAEAASHLPPGEFVLVISATELRLEWHALKRGQGGTISRVRRLGGPPP